MLIVMLLLGIYNIYLRFKTKHPITANKKEADDVVLPPEEVAEDKKDGVS